MGLLVNGVWCDEETDTRTTSGRYVRPDSQFRHWVTADGSSGFPAEAGRYHLYIAISCPWAHRTWIFHTLKRLKNVISVSIVAPRRTDQGWVFDNSTPQYQDTLLGKGYAARPVRAVTLQLGFLSKEKWQRLPHRWLAGSQYHR